MPLMFANVGVENTIKRIGGGGDSKKFLESLGFSAGSAITVMNKIGGNVIVSVKGSRVAVSEEMARKIMI